MNVPATVAFDIVAAATVVSNMVQELVNSQSAFLTCAQPEPVHQVGSATARPTRSADHEQQRAGRGNDVEGAAMSS